MQAARQRGGALDTEGNGNGEGGDDDHVPAEKDRVGLNDVGVFDSDLYSGSGQCRSSLANGNRFANKTTARYFPYMLFAQSNLFKLLILG